MKFDTDWLKEEPLAKIIAEYLKEHPDRSINKSSEFKQEGEGKDKMKKYIIPAGTVSDEEVKAFHEGIKHDSDKPRFDLIPADALEEVAKVYTVGAKKYGDRNWEKGLFYGRLCGALLRHIYAWWRGEKKDKENKCHHLSSVVFCALALLHYELNFSKFSKFDDRNKNE